MKLSMAIKGLFFSFLYSFSIVLILLGFLLFLQKLARADGMELSNVYLQHETFTFNNNNILYSQGTYPNNEINLGLKINLFKGFYMDNIVHAQMDENQYRMVGWEYKIGVKVSDGVDLGYHHFSQHSLDYASDVGYLRQDGFFIKINLMKEKETRSLW